MSVLTKPSHLIINSPVTHVVTNDPICHAPSQKPASGSSLWTSPAPYIHAPRSQDLPCCSPGVEKVSRALVVTWKSGRCSGSDHCTVGRSDPTAGPLTFPGRAGSSRRAAHPRTRIIGGGQPQPSHHCHPPYSSQPYLLTTI